MQAAEACRACLYCHTMSQRNRQRAFTLIECMMTLTVVALLLGLAIPSYGAVMERMKVSRAKTDLLQIASQVIRYRGANDGRLRRVSG